MSMYAKIVNDAVERYPYLIGDLLVENPNTSFPASPDDALLAEWGVFPVYATEPPAHDPLNESVEQATPTQINGLWTQSWIVRPATADEIATRIEAIRGDVVNSTQARLDNFARTREYDGILSLCTYATSPSAKFAAEGQYGVEARDATWAKLYEILAEVQAGTRPMPSGYSAIEAELPALVWPV